MRTYSIALLIVLTSVDLPARQSSAPAAMVSVSRELETLGTQAGEPKTVSAAGITRSDHPLLTLEGMNPFGDGPERRIVIVAGLDGDERGARAALGAVEWFKANAPEEFRRSWSLSALPMANPDGRGRLPPFRFPPVNGFFDDPEQPESRYVWRWATFQAPDLFIEIRGGAELTWQGSGVLNTRTAVLPSDSLAAAMSTASDPGAVPSSVLATAGANDGPELLQQILKAARDVRRSPLHAALAVRSARRPLDIARILAQRYPENAVVSYIPSVAWTNTLRLADVTGDLSLRQKVLRQTSPWRSGAQPLFGDRIVLTAAAGAMVYAELAARGEDAAGPLAIQAAVAASAQAASGMAEHGQGWTEDMFMSAAILARTGKMPGREQDHDRLAERLIAYATRLQRLDGVFIHFTVGQQPWGRANGFAAVGLMEALASLPASHRLRGDILSIYRRQMSGLRSMQAPDGMWREIVDEPGSYREESVTAMVLSAMASGLRRDWLDESYRPVVDRAWRALAAHIREDGGIVDVCTGTTPGETRRFYLDRPAISGFDDRGGGMALMASMEMYELTR